jgi:hypothetical protein
MSITVYTSITGSREGLAGMNTGREEKAKVIRRTRAVDTRGIYRGLGRNAKRD